MIVGISTDPVTEQQKFIDKNSFPFPLLADTKGEVARAYGAMGKGKFASRHSFIIDKKGVLRKTYTKVTPKTHAKEVLDFIKENLGK